MDGPRRRYRLLWCAVTGVLTGGSTSIAAFVYGIGLGFSGSRDERLQWIVTAVFFSALLLAAVSALYIVGWALFLRLPVARDVELSKFTLGEVFGFVTLICIVLACVANIMRGIRTEVGWSVVISAIVGWEALGAAIFAPFRRITLGVFLFSIILPYFLLAALVVAVWIARL